MRNKKVVWGMLAMALVFALASVNAQDKALRAKFLDVLKKGPALIEAMEKAKDPASFKTASTKARDEVDRFLDEELDEYLVEEKTLTKVEYDQCVALQKRYAAAEEAFAKGKSDEADVMLNSPALNTRPQTKTK